MTRLDMDSPRCLSAGLHHFNIREFSVWAQGFVPRELIAPTNRTFIAMDLRGCPRKIGTLDTDPGAKAERHVFVGSKAPWFEITDDLPQSSEYD